MTIRTALDNRGMLPKEGAALIRMTTRAQFEIRPRDEKWISCRAVGLVAVRAFDLAFVERHVRAFSKLGALSWMASKTGCADRRFAQQAARRSTRHWIVAIATRQVFRLVNRASPVKSGPAIVALKARVVHFGDLATAIASKPQDLRWIFGVGQVITARPMTRLAGPLFERSSRIL